MCRQNRVKLKNQDFKIEILEYIIDKKIHKFIIEDLLEQTYKILKQKYYKLNELFVVNYDDENFQNIKDKFLNINNIL